ncbi:MAG: hypothetical protein HRU19_29910 [Pseudobacteriovorax sp.]|nr:hypothetical protein [Pseudobacteriovorax sp.]
MKKFIFAGLMCLANTTMALNLSAQDEPNVINSIELKRGRSFDVTIFNQEDKAVTCTSVKVNFTAAFPGNCGVSILSADSIPLSSVTIEAGESHTYKSAGKDELRLLEDQYEDAEDFPYFCEGATVEAKCTLKCEYNGAIYEPGDKWEVPLTWEDPATGESLAAGKNLFICRDNGTPALNETECDAPSFKESNGQCVPVGCTGNKKHGEEWQVFNPSIGRDAVWQCSFGEQSEKSFKCITGFEKRGNECLRKCANNKAAGDTWDIDVVNGKVKGICNSDGSIGEVANSLRCNSNRFAPNGPRSCGIKGCDGSPHGTEITLSNNGATCTKTVRFCNGGAWETATRPGTCSAAPSCSDIIQRNRCVSDTRCVWSGNRCSKAGSGGGNPGPIAL